jgi:hypothetical protein
MAKGRVQAAAHPEADDLGIVYSGQWPIFDQQKLR